MTTLGTEGFGRSDTRENLRRFFEVDAECIVVATLYALAEKGRGGPTTSWPGPSRTWGWTRTKFSRSWPSERTRTAFGRVPAKIKRQKYGPKTPPLGEGADSGTVVNLFVKEGDEITKDQPILELENEKAVATIPSNGAGTVTKVFVKAGDKLSVGQRILSYGESGAAPAVAKTPKGESAPSSRPSSRRTRRPA